MKVKVILILIFFSFHFLRSQNYQTVEDLNDACASLSFSGDEDAEIAVDNILTQIGLFRNFTIQECPEINNAIAKNIEVAEGKKARYILYDAEFFNRIEDKAANDWAATSILAHEVGHHLNGHALNDEGSNHKWELEADEFSGFVLARMNSSLEDAQSAINTFKNKKATRTHPAKVDRLLAIEKGWKRGTTDIIEVKKIPKEQTEEIVENNEIVADLNITAEQVMANYIDAIGGQEKIKNIRSISKSYGNYKMIYLTPTKILKMVSQAGGGSKPALLMLPDKTYTRNSSNTKWDFMGESEPSSVSKETSFIQEYSYLVNNERLLFDGVEKVNNELCYKIAVPEKETYVYYQDLPKERLRLTLTRSYIKYYSVKTGLLKADDITSETITEIVNKRGKVIGIKSDFSSKITFQRKYNDYRAVDGVLFPFRIDNEPNLEIVTRMEINPEISRDDFDPTK